MRISPQQQRGKKKLKKKKISEQTKTVFSIQWKKRRQTIFFLLAFIYYYQTNFILRKTKPKKNLMHKHKKWRIFYIVFSRDKWEKKAAFVDMDECIFKIIKRSTARYTSCRRIYMIKQQQFNQT